jgi:Flp pilus assembly protein TadG
MTLIRQHRAATSRDGETRLRLRTRGQAAVEFALVLTIAMIVLFVSVQLALIGHASVALGQMNYQGARYAAVHPTATVSDVAKYMVSIGSPFVTKNCGSSLTVTMIEKDKDGTVTSTKGPVTGPLCPPPAPPATPARPFNSQVTVNISYDAASQFVLPNPFLGISFPLTLTSSESAMVE